MTVAARAFRNYGRGALLTALAVYSIVFTAAQFDHHSLSCHLKSRTHCTSCTFSLSSAGIEAEAEPAVLDLPEDDRLLPQTLLYTLAPVVMVVTGRSPPA